MSKKLYSTNKWKNYLRHRQEDELRKRQRHRVKKRALQAERIKRRKHEGPKFVTVTATNVFSLVRNPEEVTAFLRQVKFLGEKSNLAFDLSGITAMTSDAVAALVATIRGMPETRVRGNVPNDFAATEMLMQSGFFDYARSVNPLPPCTRGRILQKQSKKVEPTVARDLIHIGTEANYGAPRHHFSTYRVLIESMSNTHNHAGKQHAGTKTWWATVYADKLTGRVCYTFLDVGVGIFRSIKIGAMRHLYRLAGVTSNTRILRDILEGKVESSTGVAYRGKGIPAIYRLFQEGRILSLVIIANDVYANLTTGDFRVLPTEFAGTLLYWESQ